MPIGRLFAQSTKGAFVPPASIVAAGAKTIREGPDRKRSEKPAQSRFPYSMQYAYSLAGLRYTVSDEMMMPLRRA